MCIRDRSQAQWDRVQERLKLEIEVTEEWLETQETMSADVRCV